MSDTPGWADNVERMFTALLKLFERVFLALVRLFDRMVTKNRPLFWVLALGAAITLGVFDVPVFAAVVDGLVKLANALPGLVIGG